MEISEARPASIAPRPVRTDPGNGTEESDLGRGTDRERIVTQAGQSRVSTDGPEISRPNTSRYWSLRSALGHVPAKSGSGRRGLRLLVSVTALFQVLYVFVAMEIGSRRILHCDLTDRPTAEWTTQQFREILADRHPYKFVVHDRDSIFSSLLDRTLEDFGVRVFRTPIQATKANAYCERLIGTIRRECLDYVIPSTKAICG
jgi:transposase InsO family protein